MMPAERGEALPGPLTLRHRSRRQGAPLLTRGRAFLYSPRGRTASL